METSWDDVKDRFIGQEDYERLNEEQRQQAFAKFIARLHEKQSLAILSAEEGQDDDEGNRRRRDKDHQQHKKRSRRHGGDSDLSDASDVIAGKRGSKRHRSDAGGGEKGDNHSSDSGEDYGRGSGGGGRLTRKRASPERGASYGGRTLVSYDDDIEEGEVR